MFRICQKTEVKLTPQNWGVKISKKGKKNILLIYAPPIYRWVVSPSIFYVVKESVIHGLYKTEL